MLRERRGRGVGSALYREVSTWLGQRGIQELSAVRAGATIRPPSRSQNAAASASTRAASGLVLDLVGLEPPAVAPPDSIEILTWADRPS